jgi:hypothetical protein
MATSALGALAGVPRMRAALEDRERALIAAAREEGASWADIATALGLRSRQAAEQRQLRLQAAPTARRDVPGARQDKRIRSSADVRAGGGIGALRHAVTAVLGLADLPELTRRTLRIASTADPGALVDLARLAAADLERHPAGDTAAVRALRENLP